MAHSRTATPHEPIMKVPCHLFDGRASLRITGLARSRESQGSLPSDRQVDDDRGVIA
jgi:hypothetical protein